MRGTCLAVIVLAMAGLPARAEVPAPPAGSNPLLAEWKTPFGVPPFAEIRPEHYLPAYKTAIARHQDEIQAIANDARKPTFANTIAALDASGELLEKVDGVFGNLSGSNTSPEMQAIDREVSPMMAAHADDIRLNEALFRRVKTIWDGRAALKLAPDQAKLLEKTWKEFVRGGALLAPEQKERFRAINTELARLNVQFGDDVLKATNAYRLVIDVPADLSGLPEPMVKAAAEDAKAAGLEGKWVFTLHTMPGDRGFLQFADNRELRRQYLQAYLSRCDGDSLDNKPLVARIAALRAERAQLLGYKTHADYVLDENMAKTPARVYELLAQVGVPGRAKAAQEAADLQAAIRADGKDFTLEPWDWSYYAEKVRRARFDIDEQTVRPYFELQKVREGVFEVAHRLYGITMTPRPDLPVYDPSVQAYEVKDGDGKHLAIYYADYSARPSKRGGAWSNEFRTTRLRAGKPVRPIVVNCYNFGTPRPGQPVLLGLDDVTTVFHEFGHALHAMLSQVRYGSLNSVPRDFVELPSQIMENWALEPEVLKIYARHDQTGEVIPMELVEKIRKARTFNQGFETTEYVAASVLDMDWHTLADAKEQPDVNAFETASMGRIQEPAAVPPRYRSVYFRHTFSGGYSAGYYAYLWAEVLEADAFRAFKEKGIFDPATALSFRRNILEQGGNEDAMKLYVRFRGREPSVQPLLEKRGLVAAQP